MRLLKYAATATLIVFASTAAVAAPDVVTEPDWIAKPNGDDLSRVYPQIALAFQIGGKAIITCQVDAFGKLSTCSVDAETPKNLGFGTAALSMAPAFQMRPQSRNGKFVGGGEVTIPLRFMLPEQPAPPTPPPPPSPRAMELARKLIALRETEDLAAVKVEGLARQLDGGKSVIPSFGRIATALRESYPLRTAQARNLTAAFVANAFTHEELTLLIAYASTPAGLAQMNGVGEDRDIRAKLGKTLNRYALGKARDQFCLQAGCKTAGDEPFKASAPNPADTIWAPLWVQEPSREVIQQFLPGPANALNISGGARLICAIDTLGTLRECNTVGETPKGLGFAASAKALSSYYRLAPAQLGQGAINKHVVVEIWFRAEASDSVEPLPEFKPRSQRALALARELIPLQYDDQGLQSAMRTLMDKQRNAAASSGLTPQDFDKLEDALVHGNQAAIDQGREVTAAYLTTQLTDEQIVAAIRFWRGPAGRAWKTKAPAVQAQAASASAIYGRLVLADAGRAFCKVEDCEGLTLKSTQPASAPSSAPSTRTP